MKDELIRAEMTVKGKVQKVQFRNWAKKTAKKHHLVGTAINLSNYDEDVAVICEGPRKTIKRFVQDLKEEARPPIRIDAIQVEYSAPTGEFEDFTFERSTDMTNALVERLDCIIEYMSLIDRRLEELNSKVDKFSYIARKHRST
jgi:acylphosphatase